MKQIYVTLKPEYEFRRDANDNWVRDETGLLGYAAEFSETSEKIKKKNREQEEWAGVVLEHNTWVTKHREYDYNKQAYKPIMKIEQKLIPKILDNDFLDGFTIAGTVSRSSTSNKLWRILDPRGFELEISTENMKEILLTGEVNKGVLVGKYIWDFGKNGIGKAKLIRK